MLIHTGWARHYGTPAYFDHPYLDPEAVERMLALGVRTFCIDAPSIDPTPDDDLAAHLLIADAGGVIGENFRNLEEVAMGPITATGNMNLSEKALVERLAAIPGYVDAFDAAFGEGEVTGKKIEFALAPFERTIVTLVANAP